MTLTKTQEAMEKHNEVLRQLKDAEIKEHMDEVNEKYVGRPQGRLDRYKQRVERREKRYAERQDSNAARILVGETQGLEGQLKEMVDEGNEELEQKLSKKPRLLLKLAVLGLAGAAAWGLADNWIQLDEYTAQPGDGFSNVAYDLDIATTPENIERIAEAYEKATGNKTLQPGATAEKYLSEKVVPGRVHWE